jgi:glyoxylase-like metal-dependent hydrolase (beta-lactamase superfamily II)
MAQIAGYELHAIETGRFALDGGAMFGIIPRALWSRKIVPDASHRIPMAMRCLLLVDGSRAILVDTGLGHKYDEKFKGIFAVDHAHSDLESSLAHVGLGCADITDVILTHLHFDHCGGGTTKRGDRVEPTFPNAHYHVQHEHWDWARTSNRREAASFLDENLKPLRESGQLNLIDGAGLLSPGIELRIVHGHTRAQQVVLLCDEANTLAYVADLFPTSAHLPPVWGMAYDIDPLLTITEKSEFLSEASEKGWHLFFEHDADTEVLSLEETERGWRGTNPRLLDEL